MFDWLYKGLSGAAVFAAVFSTILTLKSVLDYSHAGPQIREISRRYKPYIVWSVVRLSFYTFLIVFFLGLSGSLIVESLIATGRISGGSGFNIFAAGLTAILFTGLQFVTQLFHIPSSIAASSHYRMSRMYGIWRYLGVKRLHALWGTVLTAVAVLGAWAFMSLAQYRSWLEAGALGGLLGLIVLTAWISRLPGEPRPASRRGGRRPERMNVLMIGSDTLRADRIADPAYPRTVAPRLEALAKEGIYFRNCYVPVARTAPSLVSLFTGIWPQKHGIRDNFVGLKQAKLQVPALAEYFRDVGYATAAISDWAGSDLGKFGFGFDEVDVPPDQWNVKYLIRQGPKDLRLFLSLFTHNRFGKHALPELYYLAGVPLTEHLGRHARHKIKECVDQQKPFLINLFMGTTHPPFGSRYPYYTKFADRQYLGESKFVMCKLTDPMEIIRSQREPKEAFDLDQILDLYDGCVANFDHEVAKLLDYLDASGCADNTIVIVYSDHGMEFFEHHTWGQGNSAIGDFSARVPLIISDPRQPGVGPVDTLVRSIDIAPTLLKDVLGLEPQGLDGEALTIDESASSMGDRLAYFETGIWLTDLPGTHPRHIRYPDLLSILEVDNQKSGTLTIKKEYERLVIEAKDRMIREGAWILVRLPLVEGPMYKLFNVVDDPECQVDLSERYPDRMRSMAVKLEHWADAEPESPPSIQ